MAVPGPCKTWGELIAELGFLTLVSGAVALAPVVLAAKAGCHVGVRGHAFLYVAKVLLGLGATALVGYYMTRDEH